MSDFRVNEGRPPPLTSRERVKRRSRIAMGAAGAVLAIAVAAVVIRVPHRVAAAGYVTYERYAEVRPSAVGAVAEIRVSSGDAVEADEVMVRLVDAEERAALVEAQGRFARSAAERERLDAVTVDKRREREQALAGARLRLTHAESRVAQAQELARRGLASERALEEERARAALVRLEVETLAARTDAVSEREMAVARSEVLLASNAVESARSRLSNREVRAPIAGRAIRYEFVVGELVKPDSVLYEVFGGEKRVLKVRVPERFATLVQPGQRYRALLQPYRGVRRRWFEGRVETLRDLIETEAGRTFRVAYCTFDPGASAMPPGTSAEAWIYVGRVPLWRQVLGL